MSFRRDGNRHDAWRMWLARSEVLLSAIPPEVVANEASFRTFATEGKYSEDERAWCLTEFSPSQIRALWTFANDRTELDMDCALFDALNRAFQAAGDS